MSVSDLHADPAAHVFALDGDLVARMYALVTDLNTAIDEQRGAYDEKSERWQEGAKGINVDAWIDNLETLVAEMDAIETKPEA